MKPEKKSQSSSRDHPRRSKELPALDSKKKMRRLQKVNKETQESTRRKVKETQSTLEANNQVHTSTVVDVDDVVLEEEMEALLESEKQEEGKGTTLGNNTEASK